MVSQRKMGALLGYANIVVKNGVNLLYTPLLLRLVSQGDYGVFQMTNSTVASLSLLSLGFSAAYVRFYSQCKASGDEEKVHKLNGMYLILFTAIAFVCLLCGFFLFANTESLFNEGLTVEEISLARILIIILVINLALAFPSSVFDSYISVHEQFIFQQSRQLIVSLLSPCVSVALLFCGFGVMGIALGQLIVSILLILLNMRYSIKYLDMKFDFTHFEWSLFKGIAVFSFWLFLNQIFDLVNNNVPNFLLGAMSSSAAVAVFAIAIQIRSIFTNLSTTISNVFVPKINSMVASENNNDALTELMTRIGRYQMIVFCFFYCGFVLVGDYFIQIWAGKQYGDAYWMILVMTLPVAIPLAQNTGIEIQKAKNKHKMRSIIYIFTSVIDILICVIFIPSHGYWATTWGYVASIVLGSGLFMNWYYHFKIGLDMIFFWKKVFPVIFVSVCVLLFSGVIAYLLPVSGLIEFFVSGIVYIFLYVVALLLFILTREERNSIIRK